MHGYHLNSNRPFTCKCVYPIRSKHRGDDYSFPLRESSDGESEILTIKTSYTN
jgi:hypothetical protein